MRDDIIENDKREMMLVKLNFPYSIIDLEYTYILIYKI